MSSRPTYSRGCHACRRMKVKCDEAKPGCARCSRGSRICPGYRDDNDMVFRSMNYSFNNESKSPKRKVRHANGGPTRHCTAPTIVNPQLSTNWEDHALAFFFENYVLDSTNSGGGYLDFLPALYDKAPSHSYLKESTKAVSMACLANISSMDHITILSQKHYFRALRLVRGALDSEAEAKCDQVVTALVLLQKFEAILGLSSNSNDPHDDGLAELLRIRGPEQLNSSAGKSLYRSIRARRQIKDLKGSLYQSPDFSPDTPNFMPLPCGTELLRLFSRVSLSCWKIKNLCSQELHSLLPEFETVFMNAALLDSELLSWKSALPLAQHYHSYTMPNLEHENNQLFPIKIHVFHDIQHGAMWLGYWCARMHLLCSLSWGLRLFPSYFYHPYLQSDLQVRILNTVEDTCGSVPFMLGEINENGDMSVGSHGKALGAFFVTHALHVANSMPNIPMDQRRWILDRLIHIGHVRGIKAALKTR